MCYAEEVAASRARTESQWFAVLDGAQREYAIWERSRSILIGHRAPESENERSCRCGKMKVRDGACRDCIRVARQEFVAVRRPERALVRSFCEPVDSKARYREANREKLRAANRAYCRRRQAHRAATLAKWVAKNKERMRGLQKAWREKHRGAAKLRAQHTA